MITITSTTLFCNTCTIVTSSRKYDHIGLHGVTIWEGYRMQRSKCAIVLHCLYLSCCIYSICISLYNHKCTASHCYDSASSCENLLPGHALVSFCDLYCNIAAVRGTLFITVIQETDAYTSL
jgi:hypothetical protein